MFTYVIEFLEENNILYNYILYSYITGRTDITQE